MSCIFNALRNFKKTNKRKVVCRWFADAMCVGGSFGSYTQLPGAEIYYVSKSSFSWAILSLTDFLIYVTRRTQNMLMFY